MKSKSSAVSDIGFMGTTVVGERGQIVIPKELRDEVGLKTGSRLVLMRHGKNGPVVMFPVEHMREFMQKMTFNFAKLNKLVNE